MQNRMLTSNDETVRRGALNYKLSSSWYPVLHGFQEKTKDSRSQVCVKLMRGKRPDEGHKARYKFVIARLKPYERSARVNCFMQ